MMGMAGGGLCWVEVRRPGRNNGASVDREVDAFKRYMWR